MAVSSTCVEKQCIASLKFKTPKDPGGSVLQRFTLRGWSCWPCCCHLPDELLAGITYLQIAVLSAEEQHFEKQC